MANDNFETISQVASGAISQPQGSDDPNKILFPTESNIVSLSLKKKDKDQKEIKFDLIPWKSEVIARTPFSALQFKESLFNGCMFGSLMVFDDRNWVDDFQFSGSETLEISFKISDSDTPVNFKFFIYDAKSVSDETHLSDSTPADERISVWRLEFISSEIFLANYNTTTLEIQEDFIGNLSGDNQSLVEAIFDKYGFKVNKIEKSRTGVWLKYDQVAYPWMKQKGQMRISQLLRYLTNYAWDGNFTNYHVDYFFWEDRDGWNFRSVTDMVSNSETGESVKPTEGFVITIDPLNKNRIISFQVMNEYNIQGLLDSGALFSFYTRIDPNYDNTYLDFMDSREAFKHRDLVYEYKTYKDDMGKIEKYPLLPDAFEGKTLTDSKTLNYSARVDDEIYGYYDENYLNTPFKQNWDVYGKTLGGPWSIRAWQPQFDMTDLDVSTLKDIILNVRNKLKTKREEYAKKKNIKRKWEVYRCTICCSENAALGSTTDAFHLLNPGPVNGLTYNLLFGATGYYGTKQDEKYQIAAAGSFTDLLNYNIGATLFQRGLTYSYDLTKAPYNETIGQFYNLTGPTVPLAYNKYVIERALSLYDKAIIKLEERIADLKDFISNPNRVAAYKTKADEIYQELLIGWGYIQGGDVTVVDSFYAPNDRAIDPLIDGFKYVGEEIPGEVVRSWPIKQYEFGLVPSLKVPRGSGVSQLVWDKSLQECTDFESRTGYTYIYLCGKRYNNPNFGEYPQPVYEQQHNYSFFGGGAIQIYFKNPGEFGYYYEYENRGVTAYYHKYEIYYPLVNGEPDPNYRPYVSSGYIDASGEGFIPSEFVGYSNIGEFQYTPGRSGNSNLDYTNFIVKITPFIDYQNLNSPNDHSWNYQIGCPNSGDPRYQRYSDFNAAQGISAFVPQTVAGSLDLRKVDPVCFSPCSNDKVVRGYIQYTTNGNSLPYGNVYSYAAPYLWDEEVKDWSFFDYGTDKGLVPGIIDQNIKERTQNCLLSSDCINTTCLSSTALEVLRRTCVAEIQLLSVELEIYSQLKYKVSQFGQKFAANYAEWYQRNAFFFSKKPGESVFKNATRDTAKSPLSLQNIKSITRKEVKGSRYELLSRWTGITGASFGPNRYLINYRGISGTTFNAYYSQKYKSPGYITSRKVHNWYTYTDSDGTDDPTFRIDNRPFNPNFGPAYRGNEYKETSVIHFPSVDVSNLIRLPGGNIDQIFETRLDYGPAQSDLSEFGDLSDFKNTYNFYNTELTSKKPPDLKKEEISSYVRIEFENPIGIGTQGDFPNGFVRDAGSEYFVPYIVNLTVGPMGRQSVKYNAAVIGMDPYGFDVAVKRIKDDIPTNRKLQGLQKGNFYNWWDHDTGSVLSKTQYLTSDYNGMDLWPEVVFETEYPYYAFDPMQEDIHGGYELDFHLGGGYYFENDSQDWMESLYHYGMGSGKQFDPLYRTSVVGSYILPNGYRKLKTHRSWWSMFVPRNLFIPMRFANMMMTPNTKARDLFGGKGIFTLSPNYWRTWYGSEFESWCNISRSSLSAILRGVPETDRTPEQPPEAPDLVFFADSSAGETGEAIDPYVTARRYFTNSLNNYLSGEYLLYRPQLVTTDLWKYDLSGESEYGLITPPVDAEYDFFDRNFALQFTVHARTSTRSCKDLGLECANPKALKDGFVPLKEGCTASPYCGCPAQNLIPKEPEPTYAELQHLYNQINECTLIEEVLGREWLGCEFSDPTSSCSCNCPEQGERFKEYLEYNRTYATFWQCPLDLPLRRRAQISQLQSQKIKITVAPNKNIKIGSVVEVINGNDQPEATTNKYKKISGKWMVAEIQHNLTSTSYIMELILVRNGLHYDPNGAIEPQAVLKKQEET